MQATSSTAKVTIISIGNNIATNPIRCTVSVPLPQGSHINTVSWGKNTADSALSALDADLCISAAAFGRDYKWNVGNRVTAGFDGVVTWNDFTNDMFVSYDTTRTPAQNAMEPQRARLARGEDNEQFMMELLASENIAWVPDPNDPEVLIRNPDMENITDEHRYVDYEAEPLLPGLTICNRDKFRCDATIEAVGFIAEYKAAVSIKIDPIGMVGRANMTIALSPDRYKFGSVMYTKQRVHTVITFTFKLILHINSNRITPSVASFIMHNTIKLAKELLQELIDTIRAYNGRNVPQYLLDIYHHCVKELNGYDVRTGKFKGRNLQLWTGNERQKIGIIGAKAADIKTYIKGPMTFEFVELTAINKEALYRQNIHLVIRVDNKLEFLSFDHHFDVSFIDSPLNMLDHEMMFTVNNSAWTSIDKQMHNLVRHGYAGLAQWTHNKMDEWYHIGRRGPKPVDFFAIFNEFKNVMYPEYVRIINSIKL